MIDKATIQAYRKKYRDELFNNVIPFWMNNGMDWENGGMYTWLDRAGKVYITDKSVWLNGRAAWVFSFLCNSYGVREEWKKTAYSCLTFLTENCIDPYDKRMYFQMTKDGKPLRKRRYLFSECFYSIGCIEAGHAFNDQKYMQQGRFYYDFLMAMYRDGGKNDPFKITPKFYASTRPMLPFGVPMILLNVTHVFRRCDPERSEYYDACAKELTENMFKYFYKEEFGIFLETVGANGEFMKENYLGRTFNPGHNIEGVWFLLNQAQNSGDADLLSKVEQIFRKDVELGWNQQYGGFPHALDILGFPPDSLEADMRHWWGQNELQIAAIELYEETGDAFYWDWFEKVTEYAFRVHADPEFGEWIGYLHYDNTPLQPITKGNQYKGCFHVPRMLALVEQTLGRLEEKAVA